MRAQSLSVAVACYQDAPTIGPLVDEVARVAATLAARYRVLVIDDGSSDGAPEVLRSLVPDRPWLECRFHANNLGFGATFGELYRFDVGELNAILPGDAQIDPGQLAPMVQAMDGADVVLGVRALRRDSARRRMNSLLYNAVVSLVAGSRVRDVNSISVARTSFVRRLELRSASAFIHAEFLLECFRHGGRVREVVIDHRPRTHGAGHGGKLGVIGPTLLELAGYARRHGVALGRRRAG